MVSEAFGFYIFILTVVFAYLVWCSDWRRQTWHDYRRRGFSRTDSVNAEGIKKSVHWYIFWNYSSLSKKRISFIETFLGLILALPSVLGLVQESIGSGIQVLYSTTALGTFISIRGFYGLCKDYMATTSEYDHEFGGDIREYKDEFDGNISRDGKSFRAPLETIRYIDVGYKRSFALWDESISFYISNSKFMPYTICRRGLLSIFSRSNNTGKILLEIRRLIRNASENSHWYYLNFRYRDAADQIQRAKRGFVRSFTNDKKIRIDDYDSGALTFSSFRLSQTDYYTSQITNILSTKSEYKPNDHGGEPVRLVRHLFPVKLHEESSGKGYVLEDFGCIHHLSNHVGGVHLAISADGYPLLGLQSNNASVGPSTVVFCGAGSADWGDIANGKRISRDNNFLQVLRHAHAREVLEETGCVMQDSVRKGDVLHVGNFAAKRVKMVGLYRNVNWGGLPIFFGVSRHYITYEKYIENMRQGGKIGSRLELDCIDYRNVLSQNSAVLNPITCVDDMLKFLDEALPLFFQLHNGRIEEQSHRRAPIEIRFNDQMFIVGNILRKSRSASMAFNSFIEKDFGI
ncbi:MAG: hypothetical protein ACJLUP_21670 [Agrobacterium tumefaciens]